MRKILTISALLAVCILTSCDNSFVYECDRCGEVETVSYQLINGTDLVVCDECYEGYLQGEWDLITNTDK